LISQEDEDSNCDPAKLPRSATAQGAGRRRDSGWLRGEALGPNAGSCAAKMTSPGWSAATIGPLHFLGDLSPLDGNQIPQSPF